jgi:hypothetical protein
MSGRNKAKAPPPSSSVFFKTLFDDTDDSDPSSPVVVSKALEEEPARRRRAATIEELPFRVGQHVEALCFADNEFYLAKVAAVSGDDDDCFDVFFLETGETQHNTPFDCLRAVDGEGADQGEQQSSHEEASGWAEVGAEDFEFQKESIFLHLPVREIRVGGKLYRNVFDGKHAVTFLLENGDDFFCNVRTRREAGRLFQRMFEEGSILAVGDAGKKFADSFALFQINSKDPARTSRGPLLSRDTFAEIQSFLNEEFEQESSVVLPSAADDFAGFSMDEAAVRGAREAPVAAAASSEESAFWENIGRDVRNRQQTLRDVRRTQKVSNAELDDEIAKILGGAKAGAGPGPAKAVTSPRAAPAAFLSRTNPRAAVAAPPTNRTAPTTTRQSPPPQQPPSARPPPQFAPTALSAAGAATRGPIAVPATASSRPPKRPDAAAVASGAGTRPPQRQPAQPTVPNKQQPPPQQQQLQPPPFLGIGVVGQAFAAVRPEQVSVAAGQEVLVVARPTKAWLIVSYGDTCGSVPVSCLRHFTPYAKTQAAPRQQPQQQPQQQPPQAPRALQQSPRKR